ncbi:MAG: tyrosine--tRNA ligase [Thermaerobacter sp.]|nr:tyrosine--tRNA ligase [Thermaerobacter sp.]
MELAAKLDLLRRGTAEIVSEEELAAKLALGRPLKIKLGLDPSAPDIHLGHVVVLRKLRQFQDLGHQVICLIGDFTGRIGDPSGRSETRRQLTEDEVRENARTYAEQVFQVLDPKRTVIDFNSRWLSRLDFAQVVELAAKTTLARLLERDDFQSRFKARLPIHLHEFFYPLMQGYDSVALEADVELGGTDQKFNLLMARGLQRDYGQEPEVAMLMPILEGTDGERKMSKSLGNYIALRDAPSDMYGKVMSIPDRLLRRYQELLTDTPLEQLAAEEEAMAAGRLNPRDVKMRLARDIVGEFHGAKAARSAEEEFRRVFQRRERPEEMPTVRVAPGSRRLIELLLEAGLTPSLSEGRRQIRQGAVRVDGIPWTAEEGELAPVSGMVLQAGKRRFARVETA